MRFIMPRQKIALAFLTLQPLTIFSKKIEHDKDVYFLQERLSKCRPQNRSSWIDIPEMLWAMANYKWFQKIESKLLMGVCCSFFNVLVSQRILFFSSTTVCTDSFKSVPTEL